MQTTEKLYFTDSSILQFPATIIDVQATERGYAVQLDRTAFYPTGGGQPNDTGLLGDARVIDVFENEDGVIYHVVSQLGALAAGQAVEGRIDRARRLDHMQQHSGQHILSQAFVHACRAETRSFHLGAQTSTIDIELQSPTNEHMRAAEEIANEIIFEDRPMRVHLLNEEEASAAAAQKRIGVARPDSRDRSGRLRLVSVRRHSRIASRTDRIDCDQRIRARKEDDASRIRLRPSRA